jgi:hypothetical protein
MRQIGLLILLSLLNGPLQFREGEVPGEPASAAARQEPRPPRIAQSHLARQSNGAGPLARSIQTGRSKRERLLEIYTRDASEYVIYRDSSHHDKLELRREPVYVWTNPLREKGQDGAVFVWTWRGRAEVIGSIFSFPASGPRNVYHEFHSLALTVLDVQRPGAHKWNWAPEAPGIELRPIDGAPVPAASPSQRLAQMRTLVRDFTASTKDHTERQWKLRLLPQPLYRYESTDAEVIDGAVFGFVTSAGTDLEAFLVLEARKASSTDRPVWYFAAGRFTDTELWVRHKGSEVFAGPLIPYNLPQQEPKHRYRVYHDRDIPAVAEEAP